MKYPIFITILAIVLGFSCSKESSNTADSNKEETDASPLFRKIDNTNSGITFRNEIEDTDEVNYFLYMHLYNGAGVTILDVNNDKLPDIYFNSNMEANKLYLNKGNMQFEDITQSSGTEANFGFKMGVTAADINGDGYDDLYIC